MDTCNWESQLSASYLRITCVPKVSTHSPPDMAVAYLHTTLDVCAPLKPDGSLGACGSSASHPSIPTMIAGEVPNWICRTVNEPIL